MLRVQLGDRCMVHQELLRDLAELLAALLALGRSVVSHLLMREEVSLDTRLRCRLLGSDLDGGFAP